MAIATINPATGELIEEFTAYTDDQVDARIAAADDAFHALKDTTFATRATWMHKAGTLLEENVDAAAAMITREMGKTITQARAEVLKCASCMHFYADRAEEFLTGRELEDPSEVGATRASVRYQPIGVILAVMPWNYPLWQVVRFAAPALMAGNTGLLKHASNVPQSALYLESLFERAGFPEGAFSALLIPASGVERVLRDSRVVAATLTGSEPAGRSVASIAGSEIKHTVLELGGSDPFIVMPSADIDKAVETAVTSRTTNNAQACINAKRIIVHTDIYDDFVAKFTAAMEALVIGDPMDEATQLGPLANASGVESLDELVVDARAKGANILTGGSRIDGAGFYYSPTVITNITTEMRLYAEEAFGPVASVYKVANREEAVALANDTTFGLSSAVWTQDDDEAEFFASRIDAGAVFINGMSVSHLNLPFGGVKDSGVGRELSSEGIREFTNVKSVWRA